MWMIHCELEHFSTNTYHKKIMKQHTLICFKTLVYPAELVISLNLQSVFAVVARKKYRKKNIVE